MATQQDLDNEMASYVSASRELDTGSFAEAKATARKAGSKFFVWNGKQYTVDGMEPPEDLRKE